MRTASLTAFSLCLLASGSALAQSMGDETYGSLPTFDDRWYMIPFATYTWADTDRGTSDGAGFGFGVGKPINEWFNLELRGTYTNLSTENLRDLSRDELEDRFNTFLDRGFQGDGDFTVGDIALDGLFFFRRQGVQPFLLAGLGAINDDFDCDRTALNAAGGCESDSAWSFMAEAGAGVLVPVTDDISFRVDGRYRYDDNSGGLRDNGSFGDWIVTAGVYIPIGSRAKPVTRKYELSADALFGFNQDQLKPSGVSAIDNLARELDQVNYTAVQVDGHTDPIGSDAFNQDLSDRRANTVSNQLVTEGVPSDRINARGFGETQLKVTEADCAGAGSREALIECFQPNRRVEVTVDGVTPKK